MMLATDTAARCKPGDVNPNHRLVAAQRAARQFTGELPKKFQLGLVSFDQAARLVVPYDQPPGRAARDRPARPPGRDGDGRRAGPVPARAAPADSPPTSDGAVPGGDRAALRRRERPAPSPRSSRRRAELRIPINTVALGTPTGGRGPRPDRLRGDPRCRRTRGAAAHRAGLGGKFFERPRARTSWPRSASRWARRSASSRAARGRYIPAAAGVALLLAGAAFSLVWFGRIREPRLIVAGRQAEVPTCCLSRA